MALRAGYYGIKRGLKAKLAEIAGAWDETIQQLNSKIDWSSYAKTGVHNMCPMFPASATVAGVDYTTNDDGVITASGTSTGQAPFYCLNQGHISANNYIMSLGEDASQDLQFVVAIKRANGSTQYYVVDSANEEKPFTVNSDDIDISIYIRSNGGNKTVSGTLYPMIRLASDTDDTYAPYAKTNRELTLSAADQKTAINAIITAATGAADFAAFKAAMEAITPVTRSLSKEASPEDVPEEVIEEKPVTKKTTKKTTVKEGE